MRLHRTLVTWCVGGMVFGSTRLDSQLALFPPNPTALLYVQELKAIQFDATMAVEARNVGFVTFWDFSGGTFGAVMGMMECTFCKLEKRCFALDVLRIRFVAFTCTSIHLPSDSARDGTARDCTPYQPTDLQAGGDTLKRAVPSLAEGVRFLVNFPVFWKMCVDMVRAGAGFEFKYEILVPGTDLRGRASITGLVEVALLPKAIGGDAVSKDEDGKEDETCTRNMKHPALTEFLEALTEEEVEEREG